MCLSRQRGEAIPRTPTRGVSTMVHDVKERLEGRSVRLASRRCAFTVCNNCRCDASDFLRRGRFLLGPPRSRTRKRICSPQRKAFSFNDMQGPCQLTHCPRATQSIVTIVSMHERANCSTWNIAASLARSLHGARGRQAGGSWACRLGARGRGGWGLVGVAMAGQPDRPPAACARPPVGLGPSVVWAHAPRQRRVTLSARQPVGW